MGITACTWILDGELATRIFQFSFEAYCGTSTTLIRQPYHLLHFLSCCRCYEDLWLWSCSYCVSFMWVVGCNCLLVVWVFYGLSLSHFNMGICYVLMVLNSPVNDFVIFIWFKYILLVFWQLLYILCIRRLSEHRLSRSCLQCSHLCEIVSSA